MAGLKILRVFLLPVLLALMEIRCLDLVNEDYYSFEDPTENPTDKGGLVTQTANTSTDALNPESRGTSQTVINIMEADVGSGDGDINHTDLSADRYLFEEHPVNSTEDLPSAEQIFKEFEGDTVEATTVAVTLNEMESTKIEHIKQIYEKLGMTSELDTDFFGAAATESIEIAKEGFILNITTHQQDDRDVTVPITTEMSIISSKPDKEKLLFNISANGNLQLTTLKQETINTLLNVLEGRMETELKLEEYDKNEFISGEDEKNVVDASTEYKEFEKTYSSEKKEEIESLNAVTHAKTDTKENSIEHLVAEERNIVTETEILPQTKEVTTEAGYLPDETTVVTELISTAPSILLKASNPTETVFSLETNYENYGNSLEEYYNSQDHKETSATVDPALYEYEARSNEDESTLSTSEEIFVSKAMTETTETDFTSTIGARFVEGYRENKGLDFEGQHQINGQLDFDSSTTAQAPNEEKVTTDVTTQETLNADYVPTIKFTISTKESTLTPMYDPEATISVSTVRSWETAENFDDDYAITSLGTDSENSDSSTANVFAKLPPRAVFDILDGSIEEDLGQELEDVSTQNSAEDFSAASAEVFSTEKVGEQEEQFPSVEDNIISFTTHTPTAKVLTESVSLVTERKTDNDSESRDVHRRPSNAHSCLKLNFTGVLRTNEMTIPIPNNATVFGFCQSNGVFVNITWESEEQVKVILYLNFTEELLTNIQINLQHDNTLFEQSKKVEIQSTDEAVIIEFENQRTLELIFFEFSTNYDTSSIEDFEQAPSIEELECSSLVVAIIVGCVGLFVLLPLVGFYLYKKYTGQRDDFKPDTV